MVSFDYIVYHNKCLDGFTGFYLFLKTKKWKPDSVVYPDYPSAKQPPPDIEGKNIIVIDVAYKPHIVKQIAEKANKLLFIDHHKTIADEINNLKLKSPHEIVYDVNESGASLVWKHFFTNKKMPKFVEHIKDNDIGTWKMKHTHDFITYLEVHYPVTPEFKHIKMWDKLFDTDEIKKIIKIGKMYNNYKKYLIEKTKYSIERFPSKKLINSFKLQNIKKGKYKVAVVMLGCPTVSLVGKHIADTVDCDFVIIWKYDIKKKILVISFRSNKTDVGEIAKLFGGGGHKFASACSFKNLQIDDLFLRTQ